MTQERILEIRELLFHLERRIKPLEWDASRNQINEFKKKELVVLREQHGVLIEELGGLDQ
ncbi:hypothetical protein HQ489_02655 [Candidatus Woesearchaeota archaeon]|nr:hypothetical protein [Candidatus Woesearchaeota archaeon]